jgi:hypothetical protein
MHITANLSTFVLLSCALFGPATAGFSGRFATGGPHSGLSNQIFVARAPISNNTAHTITPHKGLNVTYAALKEPYLVLFGKSALNSSTIWASSLGSNVTGGGSK